MLGWKNGCWCCGNMLRVHWLAVPNEMPFFVWGQHIADWYWYILTPWHVNAFRYWPFATLILRSAWTNCLKGNDLPVFGMPWHSLDVIVTSCCNTLEYTGFLLPHSIMWVNFSGNGLFCCWVPGSSFQLTYIWFGKVVLRLGKSELYRLVCKSVIMVSGFQYYV